MDSDRIWILLGKRKSGEATIAELKELEALIAGQGHDDFSSEVLDKVWDAPLRAIQETGFGADSWNRIRKRLKTEADGGVLSLRTARKWLVAASILFITGSLLTYYYAVVSKKTDTAQLAAKTTNRFITQSGSKSKLELPDGTQVWLNGSSRLSFGNGNFGVRTREVYLSGEAFFDVVHNEKIPFVIHTGQVNITVKGTAFNVKAYPNEKTMEATLVRGLIEITTVKDPDRRIILKPNEKIIIPTDTVLAGNKREESTEGAAQPIYSITSLNKGRFEVLPETVWMQNKLQFDNEPFEELVPKLEAWFNIHISISEKGIRTRRFSGVIEKETLKETLADLQLSFPFDYELKGNELNIFKRK
jgi:transmembrane sensor